MSSQPSLLQSVIIDLKDAQFCPDCEAVTDCSTHCPRCTNRALMSLARVLNRPEKKKKVRKA